MSSIKSFASSLRQNSVTPPKQQGRSKHNGESLPGPKAQAALRSFDSWCVSTFGADTSVEEPQTLPPKPRQRATSEAIRKEAVEAAAFVLRQELAAQELQLLEEQRQKEVLKTNLEFAKRLITFDNWYKTNVSSELPPAGQIDTSRARSQSCAQRPEILREAAAALRGQLAVQEEELQAERRKSMILQAQLNTQFKEAADSPISDITSEDENYTLSAHEMKYLEDTDDEEIKSGNEAEARDFGCRGCSIWSFSNV
jgi:hypothetical protein